MQPQNPAVPGCLRLSHEAMATTFEVFILHPDATYAEQAAWAAFERLDQLERELSRYVENSDVSRINNLDSDRPVRIGLAAFECLRLCARLHADTRGAFDVTVGSLMDCWLNPNKTRRTPSDEELEIARRRTGFHLVELNEAEHTVRLWRRGVQIDLGGVGKGYAVDQMAALLRDWGIERALLHGGRSSVLALDAPPDAKGWPLTLDRPGTRTPILARIQLRNRALSGSGLRKGQHIINPRTAQPVEGNRAAWCCASTAAIADALSTAFLVMTPRDVERYCAKHPETLAMVAGTDGHPNSQEAVVRFGRWEGVDLKNGEGTPVSRQHRRNSKKTTRK